VARLRKLKGKWYVRVRLPNTKEKLIPTGSGDERIAKQRLRLVQEKEFLVKAKLMDEFELDPMTLRESKEQFLAYCRRKNLRPGTLKSYTTSIDNLFMSVTPFSSVRVLNKGIIQKFQEDLIKRKLAGNSININLRSVRAFTNWLLREKYLPHQIEYDFLKVDKGLPKLLLPDELKKIYKLCENGKMRASFRVYEHLGLRLGELHHCVKEGEFVRVVAETAKGRRDRIIPLPVEIIPDFELATSNPYDKFRISKAFTKLRKDAKIGDEKSLHSLRHTFAARMLLETNNIKIVKDLLGHSDIKTTEIYLNYPTEYLKAMLKTNSNKSAKVELAEA
jgi:site-specific recombinase XerD